MNETIPDIIRDKNPLNYKNNTIPEPLPEYASLIHMKKLASLNKLYKTYIGSKIFNK